MTDNVEFEISAKDNSDATIKGVTNNLAGLQETVQDFVAELVAFDKGLTAAQKSLSGVGGATGDASKATKEAAVAAQASSSEWSNLATELKEVKSAYADIVQEAVAAGKSANSVIGSISPEIRNQAVRVDAGRNPDLVRDSKAAAKRDAEELATLNGLFAKAEADKRAEMQKTANEAKASAVEREKGEREFRQAELDGIRKGMQQRANAAAETEKQFQKDYKLLQAQETAQQKATATELRGLREERQLKEQIANIDAKKAADRNRAANVAQETSRTGELAAMRHELLAGAAAGTRFASVTGEVTRNTNGLFGSLNQVDGSLANARYAMHDVSMTAGMMGAAITAAMGGAVHAVAEYETGMANIERTGELSKQQAAQLRDEFVGLAQEIPLAFGELSRIGELGGQLNVSADKLADFTESVAMMSATTDVSVDASATAFGRLDALLPDVQGQYNRLGSSILKVGINSVATESEIISTTSQIAAAGSAAGMTASQVIGLSASFASLGVAPESARGTVIRVLGLMNAAVSEGGEKLDNFARVADVSADTFKKSWGTEDFTNTFVKFLEGVNKEGNGAQLAIKGLGISAARDQNNLLKLSQNTEVVTGTMSDAAVGFGNAGFMSEQFGIKAETLAAKIQLAANNIQNLIAQAGELGGGALGGVLDVVNGLLESATALADNPLVQWMVSAYAGLVALAGMALLAGSGLGRMAASSMALVPLKGVLDNITNSIRAQHAAIVANNSQLTVMQARIATARSLAVGLGTALRGLAITSGVTAGVALAFWGLSKAIDASKSSADKAKATLGSVDTLMAATAEDVKAATKEFGSVENALKDTGSGYKSLAVDVDTGSKAFVDAEKSVSSTADSQGNLELATRSASGAIREQNILIGENTKRAMIDAITGIDGMSTALVTLSGYGFDMRGFLGDLGSGDIEAANQRLAEFTSTVDTSGDSLADNFNKSREVGQALKLVASASTTAGGALDLMAVQQEFAAATGIELSGVVGDSGDAFNEAEDGADALAQSLSSLSEEFSGLKSAASLGEAMAKLIENFGGAAIAGEVMGGAVVGNVDDIQNAVKAAIESGAAFGYSAAESVAALFAQLKAEGIDTANLLLQLQGFGMTSLGGVSFDNITKQMNQASPAVQGLSNFFGDLANNARDSGEKSSKAAKKTADAAKKAVRTTIDYANDLRGIWERAFSIRFDKLLTTDGITSSFIDIKERVADARERVNDFKLKLQELKAAGQQLKSDKAITEYFLSVAEGYKDTLRAGELKAELAKINSDLANNANEQKKNQKEQSKAQNEASLSLKGNSKQAIENRKTITDLVAQYQEKIAVLAESGLSEKKLKSETENLKKEFEKQATQLGFNRSELKKYTSGFNDVSAAIRNVPRDVTVKANMNPAAQALNEFKDKAKAAMDKVKSSTDKTNGSLSNTAAYASKINTSFNRAVPTKMSQSLSVETLKMRAKLRATAEVASISMDIIKASLGGNSAKVRTLKTQLAYWKNIADNYSSGGFTGRGGKYEAAGIVHKGEYVIPQEGVNQATGKPNPEWLARNLTNTAPGAASSARINTMSAARTVDSMQRVMVVNPIELGAQSLHILSNNGGGDVVITQNQIGTAAGKSNVRNTQIGSS